MHLETQTKKLAQTFFLLMACLLAGIAFLVAARTQRHASTQYSANSPLYTYQNPFGQPANTSSIAFSQANAGGALSKMLSVSWIMGLSGLGALWLGASFYLYGGHRRNGKPIDRNREKTADTETRMNPLAVIPPRQIMPVAEQDKVSLPVSTVLCRTKTRGSFAHRTITAPCQSRFRPTTLASNQPRFGRLK